MLLRHVLGPGVPQTAQSALGRLKSPGVRKGCLCSAVLRLDNLLVFPVKYIIKDVTFFLFFVMLICQTQESVSDQRSCSK